MLFRSLGEALDEQYPGKRRIFVFASLADKDTETVLQLLVRKGDMVFACEAPTPRTRKAEEIGTMLESQKIKAEFKAEHSVDEALSDAAAAAGENDIVMICGSLYILGDAIRFIEEKEASAAEETK